MSSYYKEKVPENGSVKGLRIFCGILFAIEIILTTFPFTYMYDNLGNVMLDEANNPVEMTAFQMIYQPGGYASDSAVKLAFVASLFVILPLVSFFFCILSKKSGAKYLISALTCIINALIITFGIGADIRIGALISLLLYVLILFLTMLGLGNFLKSKDK